MHSDTTQWQANANYFDFEGNQIAYWTGGSGKPLLLIHGYPTASWDWVPIWDTLSASHSLIACDMLGFGFSAKPRNGLRGDGYSLMHQTDLHQALLDHLEIEQFDALVHDYGVSVGQEMLARQARNTGFTGLDQIVFLNGGIFPDHHRPRPIQKLGVSPMGFLLSLLMSRKRFGQSFSEVFGPDTQPSEQELDEFWKLIAHNRGQAIQHKLLRYMIDRQTHKIRWQEALVGAQHQIGLINGALDPVSGEHVYRKWCEIVPNARHHLISGVGHYPQVEAPREVATKALEWLAIQT